MANFIPLQLDKDTGKTVATRAGIPAAGGTLPPLGPGLFYTAVFVHQQAIVVDTWVITHNANTLNYQVQIFDAAGNLLLPDAVETVDVNTVRVTFGTAIDGKAVLVVALDG